MSSEAAAAALRLLLPDAQIALAWWRAERIWKKAALRSVIRPRSPFEPRHWSRPKTVNDLIYLTIANSARNKRRVKSGPECFWKWRMYMRTELFSETECVLQCELSNVDADSCTCRCRRFPRYQLVSYDLFRNVTHWAQLQCCGSNLSAISELKIRFSKTLGQTKQTNPAGYCLWKSLRLTTDIRMKMCTEYLQKYFELPECRM